MHVPMFLVVYYMYPRPLLPRLTFLPTPAWPVFGEEMGLSWGGAHVIRIDGFGLEVGGG